MENVLKVAESIKGRLNGTSEYSVMRGPHGDTFLLMQNDGDGEFPILHVMGDYQLLVYGDGKSVIGKAVEMGLFDAGYELLFKPVKIGGGSLYLYKEKSPTE